MTRSDLLVQRLRCLTHLGSDPCGFATLDLFAWSRNLAFVVEDVRIIKPMYETSTICIAGTAVPERVFCWSRGSPFGLYFARRTKN